MINSFVDYLATAFEASMLYIIMKRRDENSWSTFLVSSIIYVLFVRVLTLFNLSPFIKLGILVVVVNVIGISIYKNKNIKAFTLSILHFMSIYLGELVIQTGLLFFVEDLTHLSKHFLLWFWAILVSKILGLIFCFFFKSMFGEMNYCSWMAILQCIPLFVVLGIMAKIQEYLFGYSNSSFILGESLLLLGIIISSICLLFIYRYYFQLKEIQVAKKLNEKQMISIFNMYYNRLEAEKHNRQIYHDIKAHIYTLEHLQDEDKRELYRLELLEQLKEAVIYYETGNEFVDIILNEKKRICDQYKIEVRCIGNLGELNILKPIDIITIFHNALDNAIHEYHKKEHLERIIKIQVWKFRDFLNIRFTNNYIVNEHIEDDLDMDMHGYGLQNIRSVVERYDGEMDTAVENEKYILKIIIPLLK